MPTYTSTTTIGTTKPTGATDSQPALKKFWLTMDVSDPDVYDLFETYAAISDASYLENLSTQSSYDFKIGAPSITNFGYNAMIVSYGAIQSYRVNWASYTYDSFGILYSQGAAQNNSFPGVYQPPFAWEDGIWHLRTYLTFEGGDLFYASDAYFMLTENLDCCIAKYSAKIASGCTTKALDKATQMLTYRELAYRAFDAGDYNDAAIMLKKATELCNSTGCNCGCN
jgi:hypothetical protein